MYLVYVHIHCTSGCGMFIISPALCMEGISSCQQNRALPTNNQSLRDPPPPAHPSKANNVGETLILLMFAAVAVFE